MEERGDAAAVRDEGLDFGVLFFDVGVRAFRWGRRGEGVHARGEEVCCAAGDEAWLTEGRGARPCTVR